MKKSTWIILGLVVVLGLIYLLTREDHVSVGVKRLALPVFVADNVDRIEIKSKDNVVLLKQNGKWMLELKDQEKSRLVRADQSNVASMLDAALQVRHSHYVTNLKEKLPELGLEGPEVVEVKVYSGDAVVWSLLLGKNAAGSGRYAKLLTDGDIYVVRGSFWQLTRNGIIDWRDREIMPIKEGEITSFNISKAGEPYMSLVKSKDSDEWNFDPSQKLWPGFRADKAGLAGIVRAALNLKASGFVDEARDLKAPLLKIGVAGTEGKYELQFFPGAKDDFLAKRADDDQIYEVSKFNFDKVNRSLEDLRDLTILSFDKSTITKLMLVHGKEHIVVSKKDGAWQIEQPQTLPAGFEFDPVAVDDMLSSLSGLTAQRIANPSKDQPQNPNWQNNWLVELTTDKGNKIDLYASKSKSGGDDYVVRGNIDQEIYIVKGPRLSSVHAGLNAFKKEDFELPPIDENTKGFESLPVDVQRKLLDAAKKKQ